MKQNFYTNIRLLTLLAFTSLCIQVSAAEKPNVLFIAVDDLNDWAGYFGNSQAITPNMDSLADDGVWFSKAYCQYPVCGPSRASLMSGLYFHQLNSPKLQPDDDFVEKTVQDMGSKLLHGYFKEHGYKTMAVGKILHKHLPMRTSIFRAVVEGGIFSKTKRQVKRSNSIGNLKLLSLIGARGKNPKKR